MIVRYFAIALAALIVNAVLIIFFHTGLLASAIAGAVVSIIVGIALDYFKVLERKE